MFSNKMSREFKMDEVPDCESFQCTSEIILETDIIKVEVDKKYIKNVGEIGTTCESSKCMLGWREKEEEEAPADFLDLLYHDEDEEVSEDDLEVESDEDEQAPTYDASLDRSRSPIDFSSEFAVQPATDLVTYEESEDARLLAPGAHNLFVSPEERDRNERSRRMSKRRGVRDVRGQSTRGSGSGRPIRGRRGGQQWAVGHPLNEFWARNEDVPSELVNLEMDAMWDQQTRLQDAARSGRKAKRDDACERKGEDEYLDAIDGVDALPWLEGQKLHFEWSPMDSYQGREENFKPKHTGSVHVFSSPYDAFRSYWSDDILSLIVAETNQYATTISSAAFQSDWIPTNRHEILCLFAFWMMLGIVRMPTTDSCFSVDPLLKTEVFRRIFTRKRYEILNRAIHFLDPDPANYDSDSDNNCASSSNQLHRLRPIIKHLNSAFQSNYVLSRDICIDENLALWKYHALKFGIKTYELKESTTGYLWSFIVYSSKHIATDRITDDLRIKAVVKLIDPLLNKGYRLFMNNCSPLLARFLKLNGTDCVGTLKSSRHDVPVVIYKAPLKRGEYIARHSGDVTILSWQDNERVTMISTCHGSSTALPTVSSKATSRPVPFKPQMVLDYNKFMRAVDIKDQMLEPYLLELKRFFKLYMKLFKRLLNVSVFNSRILLNSSTHTYQDHLAFRLQLVDTILTNHLSYCPQNCKVNSITSTTRLRPDRQVDSTHWPMLLEPTEGSMARNRKFCKRCVVCLREGRKSQKSPYCCEVCRVPLCIVNCFKIYHTSPL